MGTRSRGTKYIKIQVCNNYGNIRLNFRLTAKQKKNREHEEKISKKMLGLDKYEAEKSKEKWYSKYVRNGLFSTKNAVIGVSAVIFAAAGTAAYFAQFHL